MWKSKVSKRNVHPEKLRIIPVAQKYTSDILGIFWSDIKNDNITKRLRISPTGAIQHAYQHINCLGIKKVKGPNIGLKCAPNFKVGV